jgi:hypothetical protein
MATTINSGYANSPKLTANIADHADVYGGRALVFDGVTDYLQASVGYTLTDATFSLWFNKDTSHTGYIFNIYESTSSGWGLRISSNDVGIYDDSNANDATVYSTAVSSNVWYHIAVTISNNEQKLYLNGELKGSGTDIASSLSGIDGDLFIGSRRSDQQYFDGSMCDFKIFNTALTEAQVQELYKKPENTPSAVQDNLVAWYPMCEGNPESPQSIVYDHSEKKLDTNLVTNSTFDSDISGWSQNGSDSERTIAHATVDGRTCIDINDASTSERFNAQFDLGSNAEDGELYKISYFVRKAQTGSTSKDFIVGLGFTNVGGDAGNVDKTVAEYDTWEFQEIYIICGTANNYLQFLPTAYDNAHVGRLYLDDVKVQKVLMGNHATTNFFGDELITNGDFSSATGWTDASNIISSGVAHFNTTGTLQYIEQTNKTVVGKTYQLKYDITEYTSGTIKTYYSPTVTLSTSVASHTTTFVAEHTNFGLKRGSGSGTTNIKIDNVSLKEVGISSSGFETAVNEPVVPQVPLMRYNQKMLISSDASADTYVLLPDGLTKGLTEFTFSIWHRKNIGDASMLFSVDGGGSYIRFLSPTRLFAHMPGQTGSFTLDVAGITDDGNLHHYVLSMSASSNESKLYIDGVLKETDTNDGNYYNSNIRRIGNYAGVQSPSMHDEFSIFNTALTDAEAQELFNDGVALDATTHSKKGNLLGYWRNDGVTTWQDRRGWSYLDFDGNDKIVTNLNSTPADATYIWWMKATATNTNAVFGHGTSSQTGFILNWAGTNKPLLYLNSSNFRYFSLNDAQDDGAWHCFALVNDNDDITNAKLYIDGVEQSATSTTSTGADPSHSTGLTIGYASSYFNGSIAQFAVYSDLKDSTFITSKFNQGINSDLSSDSNLVAYYKMDNTSTIIDLIGSNNGTVTGTTLNTGNNGDVQGSPDSITIREGLNSNRDGLGFYFTNPSSNVLRLGRIHGEYLNVGSPKSLDDIWHGGGTVELWVKPEGETGNMGIMHKAGNGNQGWTLKTDTYSNGWHLRFDAIFSGANYTFQKNSYLKKDIWTYIAVTYSSNAGEQATIYTSNESGVLSAITSPNTNTTSTDTYTSDAGQDLIIGSKEGDSTKFNGLMDEIRIYNRALSLDEITKNFKHQKGKHKND